VDRTSTMQRPEGKKKSRVSCIAGERNRRGVGMDFE
jgi:hypothetical protein